MPSFPLPILATIAALGIAASPTHAEPAHGRAAPTRATQAKVPAAGKTADNRHRKARQGP
ncbi:hypothetical protein DM806_19655 [Sphingobium lactosutens]|uniref:hypothetical protein n=1 Tax=Sphingobium lactosutens TaxID=522773 RepID=UPI0015B87007|nr:hypothetical protein [Sphingobium lactosutens]NWK97830.1 hypothetical protein [Sphingobium lactosutens]